MKFFSLCLMSVLYTAPVLASADYSSMLNKLDQKITQLENQKQTHTPDRTVTVPWDIVDKREGNLWSAITKSYDFLRSFYVSERYNYLYEGMRANSLGHPQRIDSLKTWIQRENKLLVSKRLNPKFYNEWNEHVSRIKTAIDEIAKPRPEVRSVVAGRDLQNEQYLFLKEVKKELESLEKSSKPKIITVMNTNPEVIETAPTFLETMGSNNGLMILGGLNILTLGLFLFGRKNNKKQVRRVNNNPVVSKPVYDLPPLPLEAMETEALDNAMDMDNTEPTHPGINLEEECLKVIEENDHLLKIADIKVYPVNRSPFKTNVHVPQEKVTEALQWLLKGTIAIANTTGSKISHMEWNCRENGGRVSLDLVLHGLECDYKSLYLNALVEGDGSAPAHFGRTEMALDGHLPSVMFKKGNKKTTISLGVDSHGHSLSH